MIPSGFLLESNYTYFDLANLHTIEIQLLQLCLIFDSFSNSQSSISLDLTERQIQFLKMQKDILSAELLLRSIVSINFMSSQMSWKD